MAIAYRVANQTFSSGTTPRTVSTSGVISGDLVILALCFANSIATGAITPPSGFTLIASSGVTDTPSIYLYSKVAGGSEPATYSVSWTGGGEGELGLLALTSDAALPLVVDAVAAQHNASGNRLWPSITVAAAASFLACFAALTTNVATTPHSGMDERLDLANSLRCYLMTQTLSSSGATGTRTGTGTASVSSTVSLAIAEQVPAPDAPSDLTAEALSASTVMLSWQNNAAVGTYDGVSIERSLSEMSGYSEVDTVAAGVDTFTDTGLAQNTRYYWRIRAFVND